MQHPNAYPSVLSFLKKEFPKPSISLHPKYELSGPRLCLSQAGAGTFTKTFLFVQNVEGALGRINFYFLSRLDHRGASKGIYQCG